MVVIVAGILAAGMAYVINRQIVMLVGSKGIVEFIPIIEETLKTGLAVVLGASIIGTHFVFGLIEGMYDFFTTAPRGAWASIVSVFSHLLFGTITLVVSFNFGIVIAIIASSVIHSSWNALIVRIAEHKRPNKLSRPNRR